MSVICAAKINTRELTWDSQRRWFIAEASELPQPGRIWDDAADIGYELISHRTGEAVLFYLHKEIRDRDGDIEAWIYRPVRTEVEAELHVLND